MNPEEQMMMEEQMMAEEAGMAPAAGGDVAAQNAQMLQEIGQIVSENNQMIKEIGQMISEAMGGGQPEGGPATQAMTEEDMLREEAMARLEQG